MGVAKRWPLATNRIEHHKHINIVLRCESVKILLCSNALFEESIKKHKFHCASVGELLSNTRNIKNKRKRNCIDRAIANARLIVTRRSKRTTQQAYAVVVRCEYNALRAAVQTCDEVLHFRTFCEKHVSLNVPGRRKRRYNTIEHLLVSACAYTAWHSKTKQIKSEIFFLPNGKRLLISAHSNVDLMLPQRDLR